MPVAVVAVGGEAPEQAAMDIANYLNEAYFSHIRPRNLL
jgi:hypothetical protein